MTPRGRSHCVGPAGPYCATMDSRLAGALYATRCAGLLLLELTRTDTGATRIAGVVHRAHARDRGLMLNHCPWCGADIAPVSAKKTPERSDE